MGVRVAAEGAAEEGKGQQVVELKAQMEHRGPGRSVDYFVPQLVLLSVPTAQVATVLT